MRRVITTLAFGLLLFTGCAEEDPQKATPTGPDASVTTQPVPANFHGVGSGYKGTDPR
jgi:hypothetical protein